MGRGAALVRSTLELLLPRACAACGGASANGTADLICSLCWSRLPALAHPQCPRCGHPTLGESCALCATLPPFIRAVRSVCWVPHPVSSGIVGALKYDGWQAVGREMAVRMARLPWPSDVVRERAAVIPVPLHPTRERERGFNQAAELAAALGAHWRVPAWADVLTRNRTTETQTRLTPAERSANVHEAFRVRDGARLHGQHVVLVDDVLTTGATLNACAKALFDGGARILSYVTFGRAHAGADR